MMYALVRGNWKLVGGVSPQKHVLNCVALHEFLVRLQACLSEKSRLMGGDSRIPNVRHCALSCSTFPMLQTHVTVQEGGSR